MSASVPERCTVCDTPIVAGESRCRACGKVYGEDNVCPHCHATAAVVAGSGGYTCAACGRPREKRPGTVVLEDRPGPVGTLASKVTGGGTGTEIAQRGASVGLRTVGALSIGVGVMLAILAAMIIPGGLGILAAVVLGAGGVGAGALALRAGSRASESAGRSEQVRHETRILELAEKSDGDLTVTEVARAMRVPMDEADRMLTRMVDGSRVTMEIDPEGLIHYVFRELRHLAPGQPRVRVADTADPEPAEAELELPAAEPTKRTRE